MMVLRYCEHGNLRNYLNESIDYETKIRNLGELAKGLLDIHNAERFTKIYIQEIYYLQKTKMLYCTTQSSVI